MIYEIKIQKYALKRFKKILQKNSQLGNKVDKAIDTIRQDPFHTSLRTHKVKSRRYGVKYSSRITGDLRLIWDFDQTNQNINIILILDIGGHEGAKSVY